MKHLPGPRRSLPIVSIVAVSFLLIAQLGAYLEFVLVPAPTASTTGPQNTTDLVFGLMAGIGTILGILLTLATGVLGMVAAIIDRRYRWVIAIAASGVIAMAGLFVAVGAMVSEVPRNPYDPFVAFLIVPITTLAYSALGSWVWQSEGASRRRRLSIAVAAMTVVGLLSAGAAVWGIAWINDNAGSTAAAATGSGPCSSADSVNLSLVYADGHAVQVCTNDRPACPNQTISGTMNGQRLDDVSKFTLSNQLRSSSGRYSLLITFNGALPAEATAQSLQIDPSVGKPDFPGSAPSNAGSPLAAFVYVFPRNSNDPGFTAGSGSITVWSSHGVAQGRVDGTFSQGGSRPDRPAPPQTTTPPAKITGTFACNR